MPKVQYGNTTIDYRFLEKDNLKSHYITVQKGDGVTLKGKSISEEHAQKLILKKAKWILDKLELVKSVSEDDIVTGARIQYLGRKYYVEIFINNVLESNSNRFQRIEIQDSSTKRTEPTSRIDQRLPAVFQRKGP